MTFSSSLNGVKVQWYEVNNIFILMSVINHLFNYSFWSVLFQESLDVMSTNDDNTLGFTFELYSRYMDAAKVGEMSKL